MSNLDLAKKKVWDLILSNLGAGDYIFGGAVRDHLAGEVYNDLDVYCYSRYARMAFMDRLVTAGYVVARQGISYDEHMPGYGSSDLERWNIQCDGETIQLDLVTRGEGCEAGPFNENLDLDVNGLGIKSDGKVFKACPNIADLEETLKHIAKRHFTLASEAIGAKRKAKMDKLVEQGWKPLYQPFNWATESVKLGDEVWVCVFSVQANACVVVKGKIYDTTIGSYHRPESPRIQYVAVQTDDGVKYTGIYYPSILGRALTPSPYVKPQTLTKTLKKAFANKQQQQKLQEGNMPGTGQKNFMDYVKSDLTQGGYRTAAKSVPKTARIALLAFLKTKKAPKGWIKTAKEMMETEWGLALIQQALAWGFRYFPMLKDDPRALALADEWGADSWAIVGNELVNDLMSAMAPVIAQVMNLPMPPKMRVDTSATEKTQDSSEAEIEAEAEEEATRRAVA